MGERRRPRRDFEITVEGAQREEIDLDLLARAIVIIAHDMAATSNPDQDASGSTSNEQ
jgi:hypothetical protein